MLVHLVRYFGLVVALGGLLTLAVVVPGLPSLALQAIVGVVSVTAIAVGYVWYRSVTESAIRRGLLRKERRVAEEYVAALLLVAITALYALTPILSMQSTTQCDTEYCPKFRERVVAIEYLILGLTLISGLLAFGPIIFGRTIIGPVLQEVQYLAGVMFIFMLFFLLLLFPIDVIFETCANGQGCYINMCKLASNGPPLLRLVVGWLLPPGSGC